MRKIDQRYLLIRSKTSGVDPLVDAILSSEDTPEKAAYAQVSEMRRSEVKKMYIEACLLASNDYDKISTILDIPVALLEMYAKIYYDVDGLDKLTRLELLDVSDRDEKLMKTWALSQGLDFIAWRLGRIVSINPINGLKELFTITMYKAKECIFSGNATEESKESVKWTKLSMDLARLLKAYTMDSEEARKDIEMALAEVVPEFKGLDSLDGY